MFRVCLLFSTLFFVSSSDSPGALLKSGIDKVADIFGPVKDLLPEPKVSGNDAEQESVDKKYFDDILRIWNHLDFEEATPRAVKPEEVTFHLFTKQNKNDFVNISKQNLLPLHPDKDIVFIIHGWTESRQKQWYEDLKNAILDKDDVNVVQVDWSQPASDSYPVAVLNTRDVGAIIGDFIIEIHQKRNVPLSKFTLIGHSLGGQVSGFTGKRVNEVLKKKVGKIIALDPAGPLYSSEVVSGVIQRLNATDAEMVEVIHTDGGKFGFADPCGTIDFFPNGGSAPQPGCLSLDKLISIEKISNTLFCSHHRSHQYFIEAVREGGFVGYKCKSWAVFKSGECNNNEQAEFYPSNNDTSNNNNNTSVFGKYFLRTNTKYPYAL